ncbi:hypothetical protein R1flu_015666 [Riccia fluitans]|uniref:Uncharacterized protein n=1 Tax=Riccia fluitans TaxID=41844 RepID=A0ABD1YJX5_9MARC
MPLLQRLGGSGRQRGPDVDLTGSLFTRHQGATRDNGDSDPASVRCGGPGGVEPTDGRYTCRTKRPPVRPSTDRSSRQAKLTWPAVTSNAHVLEGRLMVAADKISRVHLRVHRAEAVSDVAVSSNSGGAQSLRVILVQIPSPIDGKSRSEPNGGKAKAGKGDEGHRLSVGSRRIVPRRKLQRGGIPKGSRSELASAD